MILYSNILPIGVPMGRYIISRFGLCNSSGLARSEGRTLVLSHNTSVAWCQISTALGCLGVANKALVGCCYNLTCFTRDNKNLWPCPATPTTNFMKHIPLYICVRKKYVEKWKWQRHANHNHIILSQIPLCLILKYFRLVRAVRLGWKAN